MQGVSSKSEGRGENRERGVRTVARAGEMCLSWEERGGVVGLRVREGVLSGG